MAILRIFKYFSPGRTQLYTVFLAVCSSVVIAEGQRSGCSTPLGMESGTIRDFQLSSKTHDSGWDSPEGRLNNNRAWCSDDNDAWYEYFEIDLLKVRHVSAIATQGVKYGIISYYVKKFVVDHSFDKTSWFSYKDDAGTQKTFTGNNNANSVEKNTFRKTFVTRYLRIFPIEYKRDMCLRVELYGCKDTTDDCSEYLTNPRGSISSPGYPASYRPNLDCTWLISVSHNTGTKTALLFTRFDVASGSNQQTCDTDFVTVRDGLEESSSQIGGNYCNRYNKHKPMVIMAGSSVRIDFHSDGSSNSHIGFQIDYLPVTPGTNDVFADAACDGDLMMLNCSTSAYTINILHAFYGAYPLSCGQGFTRVTCQASDTKSKIVSKCQDFKICSIDVRGSMFAHNCPDGPVRRQLEVFYQCTSGNIRTLPPPTLGSTAPFPPTQGSTASFTMHKSTSNSQPSYSITDGTTGSESPAQSTDSLITNPPDTSAREVVVVPGTSPSTTAGSSLSSTTGAQEGDKAARSSGKIPTGVMAGVIVVVILIILIGALIAVFFILKKRRLRGKGSTIPAVAFSPEREPSPPNYSIQQRCPLSGTGVSAYETVNLLYERGEDQNAPHTRNADPNVYESSGSLHGSLPKVTENPLYESVSPPSVSDGDGGDGYEMVTPQITACNSNEYESPQQTSPHRVKSVNNPNYEKTLPLKNHDYAVPEC